jgi:hypothetical protein
MTVSEDIFSDAFDHDLQANSRNLLAVTWSRDPLQLINTYIGDMNTIYKKEKIMEIACFNVIG